MKCNTSEVLMQDPFGALSINKVERIPETFSHVVENEKEIMHGS